MQDSFHATLFISIYIFGLASHVIFSQYQIMSPRRHRKIVNRHNRSNTLSIRVGLNLRRIQTSTQLPLGRRPLDSNLSNRHNLGLCNVICSSCYAIHWIQERSYKSTINDPLFFTCCQRGRVILPPFLDAPEPLRSLLRDQTESTLLIFV